MFLAKEKKNSESSRQERIGDGLKSLCVCVVGVQGVIKFLWGGRLGEEAHRSSLVGFICCGKGFLSLLEAVGRRRSVFEQGDDMISCHEPGTVPDSHSGNKE